MPTLPLVANFTPAADDADAPRRVLAPGGYEWWSFEAFDPSADVRVVVILFDGNPFHPGYLRQYQWYRRFPTRVRPPVPRDFPCVFVRVYEKDVVVASATWQHEPGACSPTTQGVRIGADGFTRLDDGALRLTVGRSLDLTFRPRGARPAAEVLPMAAPASVAMPHGWVVSNPLCTVEGEVTIRGQRVRFEGTGYQDHHWGAEPISLAARRWFWACAWVGDQVRIVSEVVPTAVVPTRGTSRGLELIGETFPGSAVWDGRAKWRIPFPTMVDFGDALRLDDPRVIEATPTFVQLRYRAQVNGATTTALARVVEPGRVGLPIVGRLIERRIHSVRAS